MNLHQLRKIVGDRSTGSLRLTIRGGGRVTFDIGLCRLREEGVLYWKLGRQQRVEWHEILAAEVVEGSTRKP
jgi:hypothetical protein